MELITGLVERAAYLIIQLLTGLPIQVMEVPVEVV
jgi:hypothetical protein